VGVVDRRATAAFVAVVLLSLVVLFSPRAPSEHAIPDLDKVVHVGLFLLLAATTWWRFGAHRAGLVATIAYGGASEIIQWLALTNRDGDVRDFCADAAGALLGWVLARRVLARRVAARRLAARTHSR
jgi:VanZ family protein